MSDPRLARGKTRLFKALSGIRGRMIVLLLAAGIPVTAIATTNALKDYRAALDEIRRGAISLRAVMAERYGGVVGGSESLLVSLARLDPGREDAPESCATLLRRTLELHPTDLADLWIAEPDGRVACRAQPGRPEGAGTPLPLAALQGEDPVVAAFATDSAIGRMVLPVIVPIRRNGVTIRAIAATIVLNEASRRRERTEGGPVWLVDPGGSPLLISGGEAGRRPAEGIIQRIAATADVLRPEGRGDGFAYAGATLRPGLLLLVGQPVAAGEAAARALLIQRFTELATFLLVCLAVILVGADLGMVRPLRLLAARVRGWRPGHPFRVSARSTEPREVREVELAFGEAATALARREADLRAALGQRDALMAEIHHRVKNNLQIVSSLLNLQAGRIGHPAAVAEFLAARNRVRALATLHRHLYMQQSFESLSLAPFLSELANQAFTAHEEVPGDRIVLTLDLADIQLSADQAVPLSLLVTEAVGNAVAHAYPGEARGTVRLAVTMEGEMATFVIEDDGIGLPDRKSRPRGLGLQLMEGFAKQLGGELQGGRIGDGLSADGQGTRWTVRFPIRENSAPRRMGSSGDSAATASKTPPNP
ncbi:sensor histidine kinase [Muricoccus radiodurans]|uniref:sensor histidine kinase n=1 Tax=Muricoccus radiodurans TaxID=2231721 RepID=UPI003CF864F5